MHLHPPSHSSIHVYNLCQDCVMKHGLQLLPIDSIALMPIQSQVPVNRDELYRRLDKTYTDEVLSSNLPSLSPQPHHTDLPLL